MDLTDSAVDLVLDVIDAAVDVAEDVEDVEDLEDPHLNKEKVNWS